MRPRLEARLDTSKLGDSPLNRFLQRKREHVRMQRKLAQIALEVGADVAVPVMSATAAGDARKLRGIPAIGPGVSGAPPDWRPGFKLFRESAEEGI